jgi:hypothetical protein
MATWVMSECRDVYDHASPARTEDRQLVSPNPPVPRPAAPPPRLWSAPPRSPCRACTAVWLVLGGGLLAPQGLPLYQTRHPEMPRRLLPGLERRAVAAWGLLHNYKERKEQAQRVGLDLD